MSRLDHPKVAVVQGGDLRLIQALRNRNDRRVDEANICVRVLGADLPHADVVLPPKLFDEECAVGNVSEEGGVRNGVQSLTDEVIQLDKHRRRYDPGFPRVLDQLPARLVMPVTPVQRREEDVRIKDEAHSSGS